MSKLLGKLLGGDLRSIGKADEVVSDIINNPELFGEVFYGMKHDNPLIRMRSADVIEKVLRRHPEYLQPYKWILLDEISEIEQQEVKWHVALMFSYVRWTPKEKEKVIEKLFVWIDDSKSKIVKVNSMQALADICKCDENLRNRVLKKLKEVVREGSPAVKSRGRKSIHTLTVEH